MITPTTRPAPRHLDCVFSPEGQGWGWVVDATPEQVEATVRDLSDRLGVTLTVARVKTEGRQQIGGGTLSLPEFAAAVWKNRAYFLSQPR